MEKKKIRNLMYAFALLLSCGLSKAGFAQSANDDWVLVKDSSQVKFYYKVVSCNDHETVLFKIASSNSNTVKLNWTAWGVGTKEIVSVGPNDEKTGACALNDKLSIKVPMGMSSDHLPIVFTEFN